MWQSSTQRSRALIAEKKREREKRRSPIHLRRVMAQLKISEADGTASLIDARVVLNDLSVKGLGIFTMQPLLVGQSISLTLEYPKRIYIKGRVIWCQEIDSSSHVLSETSYQFRMGLQFVFATDEERIAVKSFCDEVMQIHVHTSHRGLPKAA